MLAPLALLCAAVVALASASAGQSLGAIEGRAAAIAAQRAGIAQLKQRRAELAEKLSATMSERFHEVATLAAERDEKLAALRLEQAQTRRELAAGLYCSECRRSKSKIERQTKGTFAAHLKQVRGRALPMTAAEIAAEMAKYDQQLEQLEQRYAQRVQTVDRALRRREQTLKSAITQANQRLFELEYALGKAVAAFDDAVQDYGSTVGRADADWHAGWQLRVARLQARHRMAELSLTLRGLVAQRRVERTRGSDARHTLEQQRAADREARAQLRATEEAKIAALVRATTGGWYAAVGVQENGGAAASSGRPSAALDELARIRARHRATGGDDRDDAEVLGQASRSRSRYDAMHAAATRLREAAGELAAHRAAVARRNLERLREGLQRMRRFLKDELLPEVPEAAVEEIVQHGWENVTVRGIAGGAAFGWGSDKAQGLLVDDLRNRVRDRVGDDDAEYLSRTLEADAIDPEEGIAAWHNPFKPDALAKFFQRRIADPVLRILEEY